MRIVFIGHNGYGYPHTRVRCYHFAKMLSTMPGIEAAVLSYRDDLAPQCSEADMYNLKDRTKLRLTIKGVARLLGEKQSVLYMQKAHYHSAAMYLLHRLGFAPNYIFDYDDFDIPLSNFFHRGVWNRLFFGTNKWDDITHRLIENASGCVAASHVLLDYMKARHENVCYIPTGVDITSFSPKPNYTPQNGITLLWNGLVWGEPILQNLLFLLKAFEYAHSEIQSLRLLLVGGGSEWDRLSKKIASDYSSLPIELTGWVSPQEMPSILQSADIGLLPVMGNDMWLQCKSPTKLFEYMASGLPVIASAVGEAAHVIDHQHSGYLIRTESEMAEGIVRLARSQELRGSLGRNARRTVEEKYSLPVLAENLYSYLRQLFPDR